MESNALGFILEVISAETKKQLSDLFYHKNFHLLIPGLYSKQFTYTLPRSTPVSLPRDLYFKSRKLRTREINTLAKVHMFADGRAGI